MNIRKTDRDLACNKYHGTSFYCYASDCPVRTKEEPWPRANYRMGWLKVKSKNGKFYRKRTYICNHCGREMTAVANLEYDY